MRLTFALAIIALTVGWGVLAPVLLIAVIVLMGPFQW